MTQELTLQDLVHELDGVIADVEDGEGYDNVCHGTVLRVRDRLAELVEQEMEYEKIKTGQAVMVPINPEHARSMLSVALFYIEQHKGSFDDKVQ